MGKGAGIDDDPVVRAARRVQGFDDRAFRIVLHRGNVHAELLGFASDPRIELGEAYAAVRRRLARSEQIQVWTVDHEDVHERGVRGGKALALGNCAAMPDRIVTASATDGSFSIVAGISTELVREAQARHHLFPTAAAALGRLMTGGALLGASLKGRERLSLQIASDGPLRGLVADIALDDAGRIVARGYAQRPDVDVPLNANGKFDVGGAVGKGRLQVTRSFEVGQPYVGIVALQSGEIGDDIAGYLAESAQIPSVVAVGVLANPQGIKAAGGAIAQVMPGADERTIERLEENARTMLPITTQIANGASVEDLARALAGPLTLRLLGEHELIFRCRCSRQRVETALLALGGEELRKILTEQQNAEAICEFCKKRYVLSLPEVENLIARLEARG